MTDRREDESLRDWLVRAESDAEDLGRSAQAADDQTTTMRAQAKAWTYRRVLAEVERDLGDACPEDPDGQHFVTCGCETSDVFE
jgi:hypothetical protein